MEVASGQGGREDDVLGLRGTAVIVRADGYEGIAELCMNIGG
jgi:hypothetical protein